MKNMISRVIQCQSTVNLNIYFNYFKYVSKVHFIFYTKKYCVTFIFLFILNRKQTLVYRFFNGIRTAKIERLDRDYSNEKCYKNNASDDVRARTGSICSEITLITPFQQEQNARRQILWKMKSCRRCRRTSNTCPYFTHV